MADETNNDLEARLKADLNGGVFDSMVSGLNIGKYINQAKPFIPMAVNQARNYFGKDAVRIMIYMDEESGSFVFEKVHTSNIASFEYKEEPKAEDFFIIEKSDMDNPELFLKKIVTKFNISLI